MYVCSVREENISLLRQRWQIAKSGLPVSNEKAEVELAEILQALTEREVERAGDVEFPLFKPSMTDGGMDALVEMVSTSDFLGNCSGTERAIQKMNEEHFLNRWRMCQAGGTREEIFLGMPAATIAWFQKCSFAHIRAIIKYVGNLTTLAVNPKYVYMAGKGLHLSERSRRSMLILMS
ncbi:hypothetical protein BV908_09000 [Diaphorobacter sp. LR2014-1]|nr:hypothetical protein BV908_09000 [Diaphorobacter sp. LR2014-1]